MELLERQARSVRTNVAWLRQAERLLEGLNREQFLSSPAGLAPHRASGHVRHIIEFYECFLAGLPAGRIDYDARRRDPLLEGSREEAIRRLRVLATRLESDPHLTRDRAILLAREDSQALHADELPLTSSIGRELQFLSSHTVHHFALIAMTLRALGVQVEENFGVAPSTVRHSVQRNPEMAGAA